MFSADAQNRLNNVVHLQASQISVIDIIIDWLHSCCVICVCDYRATMQRSDPLVKAARYQSDAW